MENTFDQTATDTIDLLEARLRRIEYAIAGHAGDAAGAAPTRDPSGPISKRLADLEQSLHQLASKSRIVQDLLTLHSRYPDLFQSIPTEDLPTALSTPSILSIVLSSSSAYPATASRLTSILDVPIPTADASAQLVELVPRIARLEAVQAAQDQEVAELRARSAAVVQRWYEGDVLRVGDGWAEMEGRVERGERRVRRAVVERRREEDMV